MFSKKPTEGKIKHKEDNFDSFNYQCLDDLICSDKKDAITVDNIEDLVDNVLAKSKVTSYERHIKDIKRIRPFDKKQSVKKPKSCGGAGSIFGMSDLVSVKKLFSIVLSFVLLFAVLASASSFVDPGLDGATVSPEDMLVEDTSSSNATIPNTNHTDDTVDDGPLMEENESLNETTPPIDIDDENMTGNETIISTGLNLSLQSDKDVYLVNETVSIDGTVSYNNSLINTSVSLLIVGPGYNLSVSLNTSDGRFDYQFVPSVVGSYTVQVIVSYMNETVQEELTFNVQAITPPDITPEVSELYVWDDTDTQVKYVGDQVTFYANYSSSNLSIENASCLISFNVGTWTEPVLMSFSDGFYVYSRSFDTGEAYEYRIWCSAVGFENRSAVDEFVVSEVVSNVSEVSIVNPEEHEHVNVLPGTSFYVERTVDGPSGADVVFAPLYSDGLTIEKFEILRDNEATGLKDSSPQVFSAGRGVSNSERRIDGLREGLPVDVKSLNRVSYSQSFTIQDSCTVRIWFKAPSWEEITSGLKPSSGKISYLAFSNNGSDGFDFESSTWWDSGWGYRKLIAINSSQVPANLNNFPILVNITDTDLRDDAQNDGDDIAFVLYSNNSTQLNHEIELFDGTTGELVAWVNITSLSSTVDTKIWMYYNNSAASNQQNPTGVWDDDYWVVWHLNESSSPSQDSTANGNDGTWGAGKTAADSVDAKIGNGTDFDGVDGDLISSTAQLSALKTISFWYNRDNTVGDWSTLFEADDDDPFFGFGDGGDINDIELWYDGSQRWNSVAKSLDTWYYFVFVSDGSNSRVYLDGTDESGALANFGDTPTGFQLGDATDDEFDGIMDEFRISNIARNVSWINTCYNNQANQSTFISFESEEEISIGIITNSSTGVEETNATLMGWLQDNASADTTCYFLFNDTNDFGSPIFNLSKGVIAEGAEFENDTAGETTLTPGKLYYFKTQANNSAVWSDGSVEMFLTKPENISAFTATLNGATQIDLTWTDETGGDGAYIEYAKNSPPSPWNEGDGTPIDADGNVTSPFSHSSLDAGTHYYYKAWSYATDGGWTSSGNQTAPRGDPKTADETTPGPPSVFTNATTGIEETNATLKGWLQSNGTTDTTCYFLLNDTNDFGSPIFNLSKGVIANGAGFENDTAGETTLTKGKLYYVDTKANNSAGWNESGGVHAFLTKPDPPSSLVAQTNSTSVIYLTWSTGTGFNTTYIERNPSGETVWARGDGTMIYNNSGTNYEDTGLTDGVTYYYQAWSYTEWSSLHQWSDANASESNTTLPIPPLSISFDTPPTPANNSKRNLNWVQVNVTVTEENATSSFIDWYRSLVGYWAMDFYNSTHVFDNSTYNNDGSFQGTSFGTGNITTGNYGDALDFDGYDDYVSVSDDASLDISDEVTIEAWINNQFPTQTTNLVLEDDLALSGGQKGETTGAIADIDGDGEMEIIFLDKDGVFICSHDGTTLSEEDAYIDPLVAGDVKTAATVADPDQDGELELIFTDKNMNVFVVNHSGTTINLEATAVVGSAGWEGGNIVVIDVDNDGELEIILGGDGNGYIAILNHSGSALSTEAVYAGGAVKSGICVGDPDDDGELEIIGNNNGLLEVLNHSGAAISQEDSIATGIGEITSPSIVDVDGDGVKEIIIVAKTGLYIYNYIGSSLTLEDSIDVWGQDVKATYAVGDVDNDGQIEIIVADKAAFVAVLNHSGTTIAVEDDITASVTAMDKSGLCLADTNGDGQLEIVAVGSTGISILTHDGTTITEEDTLATNGQKHAPLVGDVDGDGTLEIAWEDDGAATVYVAGTTTGNSSVDWRQYGYEDGNCYMPYPYLVVGKEDSYGLYSGNSNAMGSINGNISTFNTSLSSGWHHVAFTYDGSTQKLYVDGALSSSAASSGAINTNTNNLIIGDNFNGLIDEVRVWNRALGWEEINASYNSNVSKLYHNFTSLADGNYTYYAYAIGTSGKSNTTETRNVTIDTQAPESNVNPISPYWNTTGVVNIIATASDNTSGVKNVTLWYKYSSNNVSWDGWVENVTDSELPWQWSFSFPNGTGYYEVYSIATDNASNVESAPGSADAICHYDYILPTVITNASTGVEETNATLKGYLSDNGGAETTCGFRYGTSSGSYSENFSVGIIADATEFSNNNGSLTPGQIHYYQAWANNSVGFSNGSEMTFLTKPDPPASLVAQTNSTSVIYLTWNTGSGFNTTYIERNASGETVWARGDGTMIYNGTGADYEDTGLAECVTYYYQAWTYANWTYDSTTLHQWSDANASANNITHDRPSIDLVNPSPNGTTGENTLPMCQIWANDSDSSTLDVYWYENSTGSYILRNTNSSVSANTIANYTFTEFSNYSITYYWKVAVNDSTYNTSAVYHFTTESINTSVDTISPYIQMSSPLNITATGQSDLDNVTLYYRWSDDNASWNGQATTSTGTFTVPGAGDTVVSGLPTDPKGIFFWGTQSTSDETNQVDASYFYGFSNGSNHRAVAATSDQGANNQWRSISTSYCVYGHDPTSEAANLEATCSMGTNKFTISYTTRNTGQIIHYMAFGGDNCSAYVNDEAVDDANSPHTGIGFTPELMLLATHGEDTSTNNQYGFISFGAAHDNGASIDQWSSEAYLSDNAADNKHSLLESGHAIGQLGAEYTEWEVTVTDMASGQFSWSTVSADSGGGDDFIFMCLNLGDADVKVGTYNKTTDAAPATQALPDLGFIPQGYLLATSCEVWGTAETADNNARIAVGAYDGSTQHSAIATDENNDNTDCHQRSNDEVLLEISQDLDTNGVQASGVAQSINDSTPDIIWNPNTATATMIGYFAIGESDWYEWSNADNPDDDYASGGWNWSFDFPNSTGYYEFYSIGNKSGSPNESAPGSADAICLYANGSITVTPAQWDIGTTTIGNYNYSTSDNYFNLTNNGTISLNIQIKAINATNSTTGAQWNLTSTPGYNNYSLQYNKSGDVSWTNINTTYDVFVTNLGIGSWQTFDLNIFMATTATNGDPLSITVTFRSVVS